jgi:DNA primase
MPANQKAQPATSGIEVSHGDRVMDVSTGVTKLDVVCYYEQVTPLMMAHLQERPTSLGRTPHSVAGENFFQKHGQARTWPGMGISVPIAWSELDQVSSGAHWGIESVPARLSQGNAKAAVSMGPAMQRLGYSAFPTEA